MTSQGKRLFVNIIRHQSFVRSQLARSIRKRTFCSRQSDDPQSQWSVDTSQVFEDTVTVTENNRTSESNAIINQNNIIAGKNIPSNPFDTVVSEDDADFPSDLSNKNQQTTDSSTQTKFKQRPAISPEDTTVLLFPGQGSQFVGMGKKLLQYPGVTELYDRASSILKYDLLDVCLNGPQSKLQDTLYCQPAIVVTSIAAMKKLAEDHPRALDHVVAASGYSVGEFSALVASGVLSFEEAVNIVDLRAKCMQKSSQKFAGGMMTVVCGHQTKLRVAMVAAKEFCRRKLDMEDPVCQVASYLCTDVKVIAGHEEALEFLRKYGREWGIIRTKRLPVSGAFHTELMKHGENTYWKYREALERATYQQPLFPIHFNSDGKRLQVNKDLSKTVPYIMSGQLSRPIKWEQMMHIVYSRPASVAYPRTFEVGPGKQMGALLSKTNKLAYDNYKYIEV